MANEYLRRTPTSTGNRKVFTWSGWVKSNIDNKSGNDNAIFMCAAQNTGNLYYRTRIGRYIVNDNDFGFNHYDGASDDYGTQALKRDHSNWEHYICAVDTTQEQTTDRVKIYLNGVYQSDLTTVVAINRNLDTYMNGTSIHFIGADGWTSTPNSYSKLLMSDVFFVDGQALTPDVFGFYKQGKGYISAGSTQATDFRPGQWVPKTPRVIKTEINRRGGFGVNGFYLPMNDSRNFGADFHGEPNSIITLNEKLPQPRVGVATTASVGLGYTDALRADPYAANLVLALPFVSGGLSSGFGDYAPSIKGSGSAKVGVTSTAVSIATTASYYGSAVNYQNNNAFVEFPGTSGDFNMGTGDFTIEGWFYPIANSGNARLFGQNTNTYNTWDVYISGSSSSGQLGMMGGAYQLTSASIQGNQWNHVAISRKNLVWTTYINGVAAGIVTSIVNNTVGDSINKFRVGAIGENAYGGVGYSFQGYIQDFRVYKGVAKYTGGFDVPKPYTPVGIATWRAVPDTTANNFATLNPLKKTTGTVTFSNGNITSVGDRSVANYSTFSTVGFSTGKWYAEIRQDAKSGTAANSLGVVSVNLTNSSQLPTYQYFCYAFSGTSNRIYSVTPSGNTYPLSDAGGTYVYDNGDIISVAADITNSKVYFAKNGVWLHTGTTSFSTSGSYDTSIPSGIEWSFGEPAAGGSGYTNSWNFGQNPTFSGNTTAGTFTDSNGKGLFKYQPPSGFLALCEDNLPTPAISNPGQYFKTVLYTGDSAASRSIVGVGFTPDLIWLKDRVSTNNAQIFDSVRGFGGNKELTPSQTYAEGGGNSALYGFVGSSNNDGFSYLTGSSNPNQANYNGDGIVAWCWRAGAGTTSTNTNGSITSVVSVNQDAGFSIVSYTGNGVDGATIGHGLGKSPALIIAKGRDNAVNWSVYHKSITASNFLYLNSTSAALASSAMWNSNPSSSVFYVGNQAQNNTNALRYIAYCWAEIEGYSKAFSYVGNGSADGPFIFLNFKPAWVLIKRTDTTGNWVVFDSSRNSTNPNNYVLYPNLSNIEDTAMNIDVLSNGFKIRDTVGNASGGTYVGMAFAESPFTTANSK